MLLGALVPLGPRVALGEVAVRRLRGQLVEQPDVVGELQHADERVLHEVDVQRAERGPAGGVLPLPQDADGLLVDDLTRERHRGAALPQVGHRLGQFVEVEGFYAADGTLIAREVEVEDFDDDEIEIEGAIEALGDASLTVLGLTFAVTDATVIRGDDDRSVSDEAMIDGLGALADRAAGHGLRVQLEFLPWSPLATLDHAARIVAGVGRANCGVHVDVWHLVRSGGSVDDLSTLDPALVGAVQLSDLAPEPWDDLFAETSSGRRLPGEGDGSAARAVVALSAAGVDAPVNLEVFSSELLTLAPADAAARLARSVGSL